MGGNFCIRLSCLGVLVWMTGMCVNIQAQTSFDEYKREAEARFNEFKAAKTQEFESYRAKANREYADFMRLAWQRFKAEPAIPVPPSPEPPAPVVASPQLIPTDDVIPFKKITPLTETPQKAVPVIPVPTPDEPTGKPQNRPRIPEKQPTHKIVFDFY